MTPSHSKIPSLMLFFVKSAKGIFTKGAVTSLVVPADLQSKAAAFLKALCVSAQDTD